MAAKPEEKGASNNERLLFAARSDDLELLQEIFDEGEYDINHQDGLGNTALHIAAMQMSTDVLEHILSEDECDVDPINRVDKATPLHLAVKLEDPEARWHIVESLLDAGADTTIKDKYGETVLDIVSLEDRRTRDMILKARATASISKDDIASDDDDEVNSGSDDD